MGNYVRIYLLDADIDTIIAHFCQQQRGLLSSICPLVGCFKSPRYFYEEVHRFASHLHANLLQRLTWPHFNNSEAWVFNEGLNIYMIDSWEAKRIDKELRRAFLASWDSPLKDVLDLSHCQFLYRHEIGILMDAYTSSPSTNQWVDEEWQNVFKEHLSRDYEVAMMTQEQ